jgi:hypothetical protein
MADTTGTAQADVKPDQLATQQLAQKEIGTRRTIGSGWAPGCVPTAYWKDGDKRIPQYADMRKEDSAVRAALMAITLTVLKNLGRFRHDDPKIEEAVNATIDNVRGGRRRMIRGLLSALWAGFAVAEPVYKIKGSSWELDKVVTRHPLTFFPNGIKPGPGNGEVEEFTQYAEDANKRVSIPRYLPNTNINKAIYWPFAAEFDEQLYGVSLLSSAYRYWFIKDQVVNWWALWAERHVNPIGIASVPPGNTYDPWEDQIVPNRTLAMNFMKNLTAGSSIAFDKSGDQAWVFDWLESNTGAGDAYEKLIYAMDNGIFRAVLMPRLALEEARFGTRAQSESNLDFFLLNVEGIMEELGGNVLIEQLAKPYILLNFGDIGDFGEWEFSPLKDEDLEVWSRVLTNLGNSGIVTFTDADSRKAREMFEKVLAPQDEADEFETANVVQQLGRYSAPAVA